METSSVKHTGELATRGKLVKILGALGISRSPEQEQAVLRLAIPAAVFAYLLLNKPTNEKSLELWVSGIQFVVVFLIIATLIFLTTIVYRKPSHARKVIGILVDTIGQSYALYLTGPIGAPWYGLYLWVILGNGFRYGERYLYLSAGTSILGFSLVSKFTPFWIDNQGLAIGLTFTLALIPAYSAILIRRLNEARQRADDASRAKSDFLSCMSHEIRTPLNGILGMTDLLRLRPLSKEDKDCVETIHVSGHALARQINEILDLSKIEAGRMTLENIDFDLYVLVNMTLRIFKSQANEKGLDLHEEIDPSTPFLLSGDPHKIRQIITNLVGNALKFTTEGAISVKIYPCEKDGNGNRLRFEVSDTGTGIPEDRLQAIFDPFTQASESVSRNFGGTGLGTTICKDLVELMDGKIGVNSTLGKGTTFWFEIPFETAEIQPGATGENWTSSTRVMYLAPAGNEGDAIETSLASRGFDLVVSHSLDTAHKALTSGAAFDALIINQFPESELLESILQGKDENIPTQTRLILIDEQGKAERNVPANGYILVNPLERNKLLNVLHTCYSRHGTEEDIIDFSSTHATRKVITRQLNILVGDDNATNRIVLQRMLEKLGHRHTIVDCGEAVLRALEEDTFDAVLTDKNMPDMNGIEVFQAYSFAHGGKPEVEFAILTADATEESRVSCEEAGIKFFLTKPVSLGKLSETLVSMCGNNMDTDEVTEFPQTAFAEDILAEDEFNTEEFDRLVELSGGDFNFIKDIIANFISDTNQNINELETSVSERDWMAFRDQAHALKGSSLYLGLTRLASLCRDAQDIEHDEFLENGVRHLTGIRKAADTAFDLLQKKLAEQTSQEMTA